MTKTTFFSKRLDDSTGSGKDSKSNDTQTASPTPANGQAEKESRWTRKRIGLITITFLLVMGILLMPTKVTQNEAKANPP